MKKRILAMFLALVMCLALLPAAALADEPTSGTCGENVTWKLENGTLTISGTGELEDYSNFKPVPWKGQREVITSAVINEGVTSVGSYAFDNCKNLISVNIPNSVASIGKYSFQYCSNLTNVTIPSGVTSIEEGVFNCCTNLTNVTIPSGVTSIEFIAFQSCANLTNVAIPNGVTSIGSSAFLGCTSLSSVTIPNSVTRIKSYAFQACTALKSVTIPDSVTNIEIHAFRETPWITQLGEFAIVNGILLAYQGNDSIVSIPNRVTVIGGGAFGNLSNLTSVIIPSSVTNINQHAFSECTGLTTVTIPDSVTGIDGWVFSGCRGLKDIYYGGSEVQWKAINVQQGNDSLASATIHYNSTDPDQTPVAPPKPEQPSTLPTVEPIPAAGTAVPSTQKVDLDGKAVEFQCYALKDEKGNPTNYVKVRDLALALNGTKAQFNVDWDGKISIIPNTAYIANGSEGTTLYSGDQAYKSVSDTPVSFNGSAVKLTSFTITYQNGGYTYYKLRDLGQLLGFNVDWTEERGMFIETDKPYGG